MFIAGFIHVIDWRQKTRLELESDKEKRWP